MQIERVRRKRTVDFARKHIRLEYGMFDPAKHPGCEDILDTIDAHPGGRFILKGSIQSWKTLLMTIWVISSFLLRPGRTGWYGQSKEAVEEWADEKWNPLVDDLDCVSRMLPAEKSKKGKVKILFPHMQFLILSAGKQLARNQKSLKNVIFDEPWTFDPGWIKEIEGRTTDYDGFFRMLFGTSGPTKGSEADKRWVDSDRRKMHVKCPGKDCGQLVDLEFFPPEVVKVRTGEGEKDWQPPGGLLFATGEEVQRGDGSVDWKKFRESVHFQCPCCGEKFRYSVRLQEKLKASAKYQVQNANAKKNYFGWEWNALIHYDWEALAEEFLEASMALKNGDYTLYEEFWRKRLGKAWDIREVLSRTKRGADASGPYKLRENWEDMVLPLMLIDVQQDHYWYVVRGFNGRGESRLIDYGKALSGGALKEVQDKWGVCGHEGELVWDDKLGSFSLPKGCGVWLDGNYRPTEARRLASAYQWGVLRGKDTELFRHKDGFRKVYGEIMAIDAYEATIGQGERYVPEVSFANGYARNLLHMVRGLDMPQRVWTWASDVEQTYLDHMESWQAKTVKRAKDDSYYLQWTKVADRDDLFWCEKAALVIASMVGIIGQGANGGKSTDDEQKTKDDDYEYTIEKVDSAERSPT